MERLASPPERRHGAMVAGQGVFHAPNGTFSIERNANVDSVCADHDVSE